MPEIPSSFEVFFDGQCPICRREIDMIRRKDKQNQLILTDIADENFVAQGVSLTQLMKEIHGRRSDGSYVKGVEVFREIYERIGFGILVKPTRLPVIRHLLDWAYQVFAKIRYSGAKRRMKKNNASCDSGACNLPP